MPPSDRHSRVRKASGERRRVSPGRSKTQQPRSKSPAAPPGRIEVAVLDGIVYVRVVGLGNALRALALKRLVEEHLRSSDGRLGQLVVDLRECASLDSTFMGTLLGFATQLQEAEAQETPVVLANPPAHVRGQLANLGLLDVEPLVVLAKRDVALPEPAKTEPLPELSSRAELHARLATIIDAHKRLIKLTPENEARFGPFLRTLLAELEAPNA